MKLTQESYIKEWENCQKCPLHKQTRNHVLTRGTIPAEVLLVGEAPGKTEDKLGIPFVGRAGQLLTKAIDKLQLASYCIANVVCCIPYKYYSPIDERASQIRPPSREEAEACHPHITQLIKLCNPGLIVLLGEQARKYHITNDVPLALLRHPAYILRKGGEGSIEFKRFLDTFHSALVEQGIACVNPLEPIGI